MTGRATTTLVCFDLGGVIVRICRDWVEGCAAAGIAVREPERFTQPRLRAQRKSLTLAHQRGELLCGAYFESVSAATDGLYTPDEIERVHGAWLLDEYRGVYRLVEDLNAAVDIRTACLSNTNDHHWRTGLLDSGRYPAIGAMRAHYVSHEMRLIKPDREIYKAVEDHAGIAGGNVVFFDDLEENILAARAVGWCAHQIDPAGEPADQMRGVLGKLGLLTGR